MSSQGDDISRRSLPTSPAIATLSVQAGRSPSFQQDRALPGPEKAIGMSDPEDEVEEVILEEFAKKAGHERAPKAKRYVIKVNKETFTVTVSSMTGREILTLAGKVPPEQYKLRQKNNDGSAKNVDLDEVV